jgi:GNAT superfamily N-acetyltransferase
MVDVHPASEEDIGALCALYLEFHEFHADRIPERLTSLRSRWDEEVTGLADRLREIVRDPGSAVLVASAESEIVGLSEVRVREDEETTAKPGCRYCHMQSLFVPAPFRGRGVGRLLLEASESWARSHGASEMRLDVWEFDEGPSGFYEARGYRPYRRSYARPLE